MATLRVWTFDTVELAGHVRELLAAEGLARGSGASATISWTRDVAAPRLDAVSDPSWSDLFDAVFLEPLRRAGRGEAPPADPTPVPLDLDQAAVNRLRDGVVPGHSALLVILERDVDRLEDRVRTQQPRLEWSARASLAPYDRGQTDLERLAGAAA